METFVFDFDFIFIVFSYNIEKYEKVFLEFLLD